MRYRDAENLITTEFAIATSQFPPMHSPHEGYAIIKEELDELWDSIRDKRHPTTLADEAKQVAAMALRFLVDCC